MIETIITYLIISVAVEAATEIMVSAEITNWVRDKLKRAAYNPDLPPINSTKQNLLVFLDKLFSCGYCFSVWVSFVFAFWAPTIVNNLFINWLLSSLILHRFSNWIHVFYELVRKGRQKAFDILLKVDD